MLNNKESIQKGILVFISYFVYNSINVLGMLGLTKADSSIKILVTIIYQSIYILILAYVYRHDLKECLKSYKLDKLSDGFKYWLIALFVTAIINRTIAYFTNSDLSDNEELVREYVKALPVFMAYNVVIFAPFVEEMIFRRAIGNIIKNMYLFIFISGFIFGLMHIPDLFTNDKIELYKLVYILPYGILGGTFAFLYKKNNNILIPMSFHFLNNSIALILQFILMGMGK